MDLQDQIIELREAQLEERQALFKEISYIDELEQSHNMNEKGWFQERDTELNEPNINNDFEPEI